MVMIIGVILSLEFLKNNDLRLFLQQIILLQSHTARAFFLSHQIHYQTVYHALFDNHLNN